MQEVSHFPVAADRDHLLISCTVLHAFILEWCNFQNRVLDEKDPSTC